MPALFVTQYCHVHFSGGGVMVIQSTCSTLKKIFLSRFIREYYAFTRWRYFSTTTRILFVQRWLGLVFKQMQRQCSNPPPQPTQFASILSPLPSEIRYFTPKFREVVRYTYF